MLAQRHNTADTLSAGSIVALAEIDTTDPINLSLGIGIPNSWPESVDPTEFVDGWVDECRERFLVATASAGPKATSAVAPAVKQFRVMIGDSPA